MNNKIIYIILSLSLLIFIINFLKTKEMIYEPFVKKVGKGVKKAKKGAKKAKKKKKKRKKTKKTKR